MNTWKFKGMQSFKFIEIFLFFLCVGICFALLIPFWDTFMGSLKISYNKRVFLIVLFIGLPAAMFATWYTKKKIDFWNISIQDSNLHIIFKKKQWDISIKDIHSINFIEVHYGKDNKRLMHFNFKGGNLKILLPENGFVADISASDFETIDDFYSYIQKSGFFTNEKVNLKVLTSDNIAKSTYLTK